MALEAWRILADGNREHVVAANLEEEDRNYEFRCMGAPGGNPCGARLKLVLPNEAEHYFRVAKDSRHANLCPFDETKPWHICSHLDLESEDENLVENLLKTLTEPEVKRVQYKSKEEDNVEPEMSETDVGKGKSGLKLKERPPHGAYELYCIFAYLGSGATYAKHQVDKLLIDHMNVEYYRENGLDNEQTAIVVGDKLNPNNLPQCIQRNKNTFVIKDCFNFEDKARQTLYFKFEVDEKAKKLILTAFRSGKRIGVFAKWALENKTTDYKCYTAMTPVNSKCVFQIKEGELRKR